MPYQFPYSSLYSVSQNSASQLLPGAYPESVFPSVILQIKNKKWTADAMAIFYYQGKITGFLDYAETGHYAVRRFLPLSILLFITLIPLPVDILRRNPWVFLRFALLG